jgi:hypothetical protein
MDHREEQDARFTKLTSMACPACGLEVLTIDLAINLVWCGVCPGPPLLERSAS